MSFQNSPLKAKACAVASCRNDSVRHPYLSFFSLPRDSYVRGEWCEVLAVKRHGDGLKGISVCERHFLEKDFCAGKKQLKHHAVPVLELGLGRTDPVDSDDEFMHCASDSDPEIVEVKQMSERGTKTTKGKPSSEVEDKKELQIPEETESFRRPSRRAAQVAAKKIYNTVRNFNLSDVANDHVSPVKSSPTTPRHSPALKPYQRKQTPAKPIRKKNLLRMRPEDMLLEMECYEELLSSVQAEALLKAQLEYNMVMKSLRSLRASNVRIVCAVGDEFEQVMPPPPVKMDNIVGGVKLPNIITVTPIKVNNSPRPPLAVPIKLTAANVVTLK